MWELDCEESSVPKNWCFWTVVLEKSLESLWDCKEIQPVHSKGGQPGCSLEGMMLKLKLQYFGHLMQRVDSLEKTLVLGGIEGRRRRGWQRMRWLDGITDWWTCVWVNSGSWWWTGRPGVLRFMRSQRVGHNWATELNWTECKFPCYSFHTSHRLLPSPHVHKSILQLHFLNLAYSVKTTLVFSLLHKYTMLTLTLWYFS